MKKEIVMWLIIAVLVIGLLLGTQKADTMAINFDGNGDRVTFPTVADWNNLSTMSACFWTKPTTLPDITTAYDAAISKLKDDGSAGWIIAQGDISIYPVTDTVVIAVGYASAPGHWFAPSSSLTVGSQNFVCITMDMSSDANNPTIYINGAAVVVTEGETPSGAYSDDSLGNMHIGGHPIGATYSIDGVLSAPRVYNVILTPEEVMLIYTGRGRDNVRRGLVWCPFLNGAAGLQAFDGATLAAGNTIVDPCSGAVGVPAGSPVGVGETYLR